MDKDHEPDSGGIARRSRGDNYLHYRVAPYYRSQGSPAH